MPIINTDLLNWIGKFDRDKSSKYYRSCINSIPGQSASTWSFSAMVKDGETFFVKEEDFSNPVP